MMFLSSMLFFPCVVRQFCNSEFWIDAWDVELFCFNFGYQILIINHFTFLLMGSTFFQNQTLRRLREH
uniref:Uncharacterized protein n=1 Tax=Solanum lycopersicum TaxID=4081 RepID=A0A3Q7GFD8_SOLLC